MNVLEYLKKASEHKKSSLIGAEMRIAIVSNFTDDILEKIFVGMCLTENIQPDIFRVPFKQYLFQLQDSTSALAKHKAQATFVFFDVNPYLESEFTSDLNHIDEIIADLERFATASAGSVILHTIALPTSLQHGRLFREHPLQAAINRYNSAIKKLAEKSSNVFIIETERLVAAMGESKARDMRGLYAFGQPFSHEYLLRVAQEWMAYVRSLAGKIRKCIVVDLDNTLWGGIVGEVGPLEIKLGPDYPGNAYREFQRVLLDYYNHGIILAANSRNNAADVDEVFEKNPYMILKKSHFAAFLTNWKTKPENLRTIAEDLNIGLDSIVFLDDDPVNRDMVKTQLPEVLVPDFSLPPEEYARTLLDLDAFHTLKMTTEDKERGKMYAAERERKVAEKETQNPEEYIKTLNIKMDFSCNDIALIPRLAQLTQKTNQFNLTTCRSTEAELTEWIKNGALIYAGDIKDKFGPYGITVMAAIKPTSKTEADLAIFLMSCRVFGRNIEFDFMKKILADLKERGFKKLTTHFIPTAKNAPSKEFLKTAGFKEVERKNSGEVVCEINVKS